jgi:hypothetical protein
VLSRTLAVVLALGAGMLATAPSARAEDRPKSAFEERVERRFVQFEITSSAADLTPDDLEVRVAGAPLTAFTLDRVCDTPGEAGPEGVPAASRPGSTFVFYFDQVFLTTSGRAMALDTVRSLVRDLVATGGGRAEIVSAAMQVRTVVPMTNDPGALLSGLDRLESDIEQWDTYALLEPRRLRDVAEARSQSVRVSRARTYQREEASRARQTFSRLRWVVSRLAGDGAPPRVLFYFADRLRQNPGLHYFDAAGMDSSSAAVTESIGGVAADFADLVASAWSQGVRFHPVQAEGLPGLSMSNSAGRGDPGRGIRDAEGTLRVLGLETGGEAFLHGTPAKKIAKRIADRYACFYIVTLDPKGLPEDRLLTLDVKSKRKGTEVTAPTSLVVESASGRRTSELLSAFVRSASADASVKVGATVLPLGSERGRYRALVQVQLAPRPDGAGSWDLGASVVSGGLVRHEFSSRLDVKSAGTPVALESIVEFEPGPFEVVAVAGKAGEPGVGAGRIAGEWPDPERDLKVVGPVAVAQSREGAFVRGESTRSAGSWIVAPDAEAGADRPTTFLSMVCRERRADAPIRVERIVEVAGERRSAGDPVVLEPSMEGCVLLRDDVPAGSFPAGAKVHYAIVASDGTKAELLAGRTIAVSPAQ